MKKKVLICDITSLTYNDRIYGHFAKVAKQYESILFSEFEVKVGGAETYLNYFSLDKMQLLPHFINFSDKPSGFLDKFKQKYKEIDNSIKGLKSNNDIIIYQCLNETPIYISLLFSGLFLKQKKVFMIQYQNGLDSKLKKLLYHIVKRKISGMIVPSQQVADFYHINSIIIPDYFPENTKELNNLNDKYIYDCVLLGTVSNWKNYDDVIESFKKTDLKILIAGKFHDEKIYNELVNKSSSNITIINKYLADEEYDTYINQSRFILLPYKKEYENKSSGILLDAMYSMKPVIVPNLTSLNLVETLKTGLTYKNSISEIIEFLYDDELYKRMLVNIVNFNNDAYKQREKLVEFIR